jgi:hypothetical protein
MSSGWVLIGLLAGLVVFWVDIGIALVVGLR